MDEKEIKACEEWATRDIKKYLQQEGRAFIAFSGFNYANYMQHLLRMG